MQWRPANGILDHVTGQLAVFWLRTRGKARSRYRKSTRVSRVGLGLCYRSCFIDLRVHHCTTTTTSMIKWDPLHWHVRSTDVDSTSVDLNWIPPYLSLHLIVILSDLPGTQKTLLTVFLPVFDRFCSARLKMPLVQRSDAKIFYENLYDSESSDRQLFRTSKISIKLLLSSEIDEVDDVLYVKNLE